MFLASTHIAYLVGKAMKALFARRLTRTQFVLSSIQSLYPKDRAAVSAAFSAIAILGIGGHRRIYCP